MIDLLQADCNMLLPQYLRQDPVIRAMHRALSAGAQLILQKTKRTGLLANIEDLPEDILDLLAIELRAQYYDQTLPAEKKREILKNALPWYMKAGTMGAVQELVSIIWDSTEAAVQEWFEYGGDPFMFKVFPGRHTTITEENIDGFFAALDRVKNERSHLEAITFVRDAKGTQYIATEQRSHMKNVVADFYTDTYKHKGSKAVFGAGMGSVKRFTIREA